MPVLTACLIQYSFITGSIPGKAASTKLTWVLGSDPNFVAEVEKSLESDKTCACTSKPITTSYLLPFFLITYWSLLT